MAKTDRQIAQQLIAIAKGLQPSVNTKGSKITISQDGKSYSVDRYRSSSIQSSTVRFR